MTEPGTQRRPAASLSAVAAAFALGAFCVLGFAPFDAWFAVWPAPTFSLAALFLAGGLPPPGRWIAAPVES